MAKIYKQILINNLKHYHDCSFTPGVYEHSVIGQAALLLEKSEEVVRCKDCKWYQIRKFDDGKPIYDCRKTHALLDVKPDDFCSCGERRE